MPLYDITRTITPRTAVWDGDTPFSYVHNMQIANGDSVNLTTINLTPHIGTHADAYYHYTPDGAFPAAMPLDAYIGSARVITVDKRDGALYPDDLGNRAHGAQRILIHSHVSNIPDTIFPTEFPYLSVELIVSLAQQGVRLIGLDSPSVDAFDSTDLPCHHALYQHNMVNLELVQLKNVPDGNYELIALPLKIDKICGSPVRAVLRA